MYDLLVQMVTSLLSGVKDGLSLFLLIAVGYLAWDRHQMKKEVEASRVLYHQTIDNLNAKMLDASDKERAELLRIIDKYYDSQISLSDALREIKAVLVNLGGKI